MTKEGCIQSHSLHLLISGYLIQNLPEKELGAIRRVRSTFSSEFLDIVQKLMDSGASLSRDLARIVLHTFTRPDLAEKLFVSRQKVRAPHDVCYFIGSNSKYDENSFMCNIAGRFDDQDATRIIPRIVSECERSCCVQCLDALSLTVHKALVRGAKQGHLQLLQALIRYSQSHSEILSAAIRGGNAEAIRFILEYEPELDPPGHEIDHKEYHTVTTPFAEAIAARDTNLIQFFESKCNLSRLKDGRRLEAAITATARAGDLQMTAKLLSAQGRSQSSDLSFALLEAIESNNEELVITLLDAGANIGQRTCNRIIYHGISRLAERWTPR